LSIVNPEISRKEDKIDPFPTIVLIIPVEIFTILILIP
jgi:hypothetical protein